MIEIENLSFRYKYANRPALNRINLKINKGEKILIAGKNGAGKTTLSKIISGIIPNTESGSIEGRYLSGGRDTKEIKYSDFVRKTAVLFQDFESQLIATSVKEELVFYPVNIGTGYKQAEEKAAELCARFGTAGLLDRNIYELSGGEKQKAALLSLLTVNPEVLILDEPFTDIEPASRKFMMDFLTGPEYRGTLIIFEQSLDYFEYFDRVIILKDGEIIYDGDKSIVQKREMLSVAGLCAPGAYKIFREPDADTIIKQYYFNAKAYEEITGRKKPEGEKIIEAKNLSYTYDGAKTQTIDNASFEIHKGDFISVLGANGSGKTTLMKILAGIIKSQKGEIIRRDKEKDLSIGYVYQNPDNQIFAETVYDEIAFILRMRKLDDAAVKDKANEIMKTMGLDEKRQEDPFTLPKGDREKIACASIIVGEPEIIILDEPTTGLDYPSLNELMSIINGLNKKGHTILMITHDMETAAQYSEKVMALSSGKIIFFGDKRKFFPERGLLEAARIERTQIMDLSLKLNSRMLLNEDEFMQCWRKK